jgi:hypothetical protein
MAQRKAAESALVTAARLLDRELEEFVVNADNLRRASLTTQRQIQRAREFLTSVAVAETVIRGRVAALSAAVDEAMGRHAALAVAMVERAPHVELRARQLEGLVDRYIGLGMRLNALGGAGASGGGDAGAVAVEVDALLVDAKSGDFPDLVQLAEGLRKQVAAAVVKPR